MAEVIEHVSNETIVKLAQLKERLGDDSQRKGYDPEGKKHLVKEYVKEFHGEIISMKDVDDFYEWKHPTANRYMQVLLEEGRVTFVREAGAMRGVQFRYFYHEQRVPKEMRTTLRSGGKRKLAVVISRHDKEIAERNLQSIAEKALEEAKPQQIAEKERLVKAERLEYIEGKVWEYLRDSTDITDMIAVNALKGFARFLRGQGIDNVQLSGAGQEGGSHRASETTDTADGTVAGREDEEELGGGDIPHPRYTD